MSYGEKRQLDVSDTFDTEIEGANWENGPGDWDSYTHVGSGFINVTNSNSSSAMNYTGFNAANDQWAKTICNAQHSGSYLSAGSRTAGGTAEAVYTATAAAAESQYQIYEFLEAIGGGIIDWVSDGGELPLTAGEYVVIENEGTTIRCGGNASGSDVEKVSTTDPTLTDGYITLGGYESDPADTDITAFEGGDLFAGNPWNHYAQQ